MNKTILSALIALLGLLYLGVSAKADLYVDYLSNHSNTLCYEYYVAGIIGSTDIAKNKFYTEADMSGLGFVDNLAIKLAYHRYIGQCGV